MRRIYALATDSAGCFYQRLQMPLDELVRQWPGEFEVVWGGVPVPEYAPGSVVIAQRFAGEQQGWLDLCKRDDVLCVYDIDDDLVDLDPANEVPYSIYQPQREGTIRNIAAAHVVTASTPNLAAKLRRWNPNVVVLPNCIADDLRRHPERHEGGLVIGWAGSMFHQQDFSDAFLREINRVATEYPLVRWVTIGANYIARALPAGVQYQSYGWGLISDYHRLLSKMDIGLAPLAETEFNRHKSWLKCLDYMACGIIPVAQDWGQYPELIHADPTLGEIGFTTSDSWMDRIAYLIEEAETGANHDMVERAWERSQQYTISRQISRWRDVYQRGPE